MACHDDVAGLLAAERHSQRAAGDSFAGLSYRELLGGLCNFKVGRSEGMFRHGASRGKRGVPTGRDGKDSVIWSFSYKTNVAGSRSSEMGWKRWLKYETLYISVGVFF